LQIGGGAASLARDVAVGHIGHSGMESYAGAG
jgi:hypothetical protein